MSENTIISKARQIRNLEAQIEKLQQQADSLKDEIKLFMGENEHIKAGEYTIHYSFVRSSKIDTAALRQFFSADDLIPFTKTTVSRRFSIA